MPPAARYEDFHLQIRKEGDRYIAEVKGSPAGTSDPEPLRWPTFGPEAHEVLRLRLENAILKSRGYRSGGFISPEERVLREFGREAYRAVFRDSGSVALRFASSLDIVRKTPHLDGLRLKMRVDPPELASLPWEYMFDESHKDKESPQNYVCLRRVSPVVRYLEVNGRDLLGLDGPLRILGMISNPSDKEWERLDAEAERHRIEEALKDIPPSQVDFQWVRGGTRDDLFSMMQQESWHIFHFIGHGGTDRYVGEGGETREEGYVVMQDGLGGAVKVSASQLALCLEGDGSLRLAVLNCCESARGNTSSVGAALVYSGVPMAVSMQFPISNDAAARFAGMFYKSLVLGHPIERALTAARQFVSGESSVEWAIPVLFTRSGSCVLFDAESRRREPGPQAPAPSAQMPARKAQALEELRRLFAAGG